MKESSKERLATLLMEELLEQLPTRERLRKMFGEMGSQPIDEVIERLLTDFERTVAEYRLNNFIEKKKEIEKRPSRLSEKKSAEVISDETDKTNGSFIPDVRPVVSQTTSSKSEPVTPQPEVSKPEPAKPEPVQVESKKTEAEKPVPTQRPASIQFNPIKLDFPKIHLKLPDGAVAKEEPVQVTPDSAVRPEAKKAPITKAHEEQLRRLEEMAKKLEAEYAVIRSQQQAEATLESFESADSPIETENPVLPTNEETVGEVFTKEDDEEIANVLDTGPAAQTSRARYQFADNEYAYVHGVSKIPEGESPVSEPFMLEEKGIDGHEFAFALDYKGLRYYLSKFSPTEMNVSKAMVLLLNKQESLQCQGAHQNVLNDLRAHGIMLPFDFGTVVRGRDSLLTMIDKNDEDIEEALVDVEKTTWWTVTASVLDATIAKIVGTDVQTVGRDRSRERASYTSTAHGKKFDIKVLERILQREKKIAEAVHSSLSAVAKRADLDTMVGLGSGSSEDWKVILKASYDVPKREVAKFNRTITDLQYHHLQYDLMLTLAGKKDSLTLRRK